MRVLITGATGLVGSEIVRLLRIRRVPVNYLTTSKKKIQKLEDYQGFYWDPEKGEMDPRSLDGVGAIIHLAGSSIFKRWTHKNKREMISSRLDGAALLFQTLKKNPRKVSHFISASGISIYPSSFTKLYTEDDREVDNSFLGHLVQKWEAAADKFSSIGLRVAKIRTGIVLSEEGGALPQMQRPIKYGVGAPLGKGRQWQSWIHIEDLARLYFHVVSNGLEGVYNAAAPHPVTNEELMQEIAKVQGKKILMPHLPGFLMKMVMGDMANIALDSQLVDSRKIQATGFTFDFVNLGKALRDLQEREQG